MNEDYFDLTDKDIKDRLWHEWRESQIANKRPIAFSVWLQREFDCELNVIKYIAGFPAEYRLQFLTPNHQLLFRLKYSEYLTSKGS